MYEQQPNPEQHPLAQGAQLPSGGILRHTSPQSGGQLAAPQADCPGSGDGGWGSSGGNEHAASVLSHWADLDGRFAREPGPHMQSAAREHDAPGAADATGPSSLSHDSAGHPTSPASAGTAHGLDPGVRKKMETSLGEDFSGVQIQRGLSTADQEAGVRAVAEPERIAVDPKTLDGQHEPEHQDRKSVV